MWRAGQCWMLDIIKTVDSQSTTINYNIVTSSFYLFIHATTNYYYCRTTGLGRHLEHVPTWIGFE